MINIKPLLRHRLFSYFHYLKKLPFEKQLRLGTWLFLIVSCLVSPAFQISANFMVFMGLCLGLALHLNAILRQNHHTLLAIFHLINSTLIGIIIGQSNAGSYLSMTILSSGHLALFFLQNYSSIFSFVMIVPYLTMHWFYSSGLVELYEPITDSYRLPASATQNMTKDWIISIVLTLTALMILQHQHRTGFNMYKAAKNSLDNTNQELTEIKSKFAQNINQLKLLTNQLEKALRSQEVLIACISHELRNPLNGILGSLDILSLEIKDEHQTNILRRCQVCGEGLLNQINNMLDVAKINCGTLEIQSKAVKMSDFLGKFWTSTNNKIESKQVKFFILVEKKLPLWLNMDAQRVQQALDNIMDNAIKFTSEGSIRVIFSWIKDQKTHNETIGSFKNLDDSRSTLETEIELSEFDEGQDVSFIPRIEKGRKSIGYIENFITIKPHLCIEQTLESGLLNQVAPSDGHLKITVLDTGCGVAKTAQENIFDPFSQMDENFIKNYAGTGFGLYIVKQLLERMGGKIKLRSIEGLGTSLKIVVPVRKLNKEDEFQTLSSKKIGSESEITKSAKKGYKSKGKSGSEASLDSRLCNRALVVDDDLFNQNLMKEYLKKLDCEVDIASNGLEGVELYKKDPWKYRFITMDIQMPVMDGITAVKEIRKFGETKKIKPIPIVYITANCCEINENEENTFYFAKPFRFSDCKNCIDEILLNNE